MANDKQLKQRAETLIRKWCALESQYSNIPLATRRELLYDNAEERVYAAAILEPGIAAHCLDFDDFKTILHGELPNESILFLDEKSPYARAWFSALAALYRRIDQDSRILTSFALQQDIAKLEKLEWKYYETEQMVAKIARSKSMVMTDDGGPTGKMMEVWNMLCHEMANGMAIPMAVLKARAILGRINARDEFDTHMGACGFRTWSEVNFTEPVWPSAQPQRAGNGQRQFNPQGAGFSNSQPKPQNRNTFGNGNQSARFGHGGQQQGSVFGAASEPKPPQQQTQANLYAAAKALFEEYQNKWKATAPHDANIPFPSPTLDAQGFKQRNTLPYAQSKVAQWTPATIISIFTKRFFLSAFAIKGILVHFGDDPTKATIDIAKLNDPTEIKKLRQKLKVEASRWHPDRLNRRSGSAGVMDQSVSERPGNVAVRVAVQELMEECDKFADGEREWVPDDR